MSKGIRKQVDHSKTPTNSKIQKQLRKDARRSQEQRRIDAEITAARMKKNADKDDWYDENTKRFKLSDEDYAKVVANNTALKEKITYGASGSKQKAMRRGEIIYVIQSLVTGEVQEIKFLNRVAAHQYFIGCKFEVIRWPEFSALTHNYKSEILDPEKSAKAAREQKESDDNDIIVDKHQDAMNRAENGEMNQDEAEELGIDLSY